MLAGVGSSRIKSFSNYCKLRNIQVEHSRTIVTIFFRMLRSEDEHRKEIVGRLLEALPYSVDKKTRSYRRMIRYLKYIVSTGGRREEDDIIIVNVDFKRSGVFKSLEQAVAQACRSENNTEIKNTCLALMKNLNMIVEHWELPQAKLLMQNMKAYQGLLDNHYDEGADIDDFTKTQRKDFMQQAISDTKNSGVPWQVGKEGEFGDDIERLDEKFLHDIMGVLWSPTKNVNLDHKSQSNLWDGMKVVTPLDVCKSMNVPVSTMRVFSTALNPAFKWEKHLVKNFKDVVISLLKNRNERENQQPVRKLFGVGMDVNVPEKGAFLEIEIEKP